MPDETARVARAAFPKGNPYLTLRDQLRLIFHDDDFVDLSPDHGQPALSPWRLAWITIMQFREHLADRHAAEAVRARIAWKYLLRLDLTDPGCDFSVLSEFRDRLLAGHAEERLLDKLLEQCQAQGLLKSRGQQRTDATHVLAAIRTRNRLELVGETLRAALNALAREAPEWLQRVAPLEWYERYSKRIEDARLPREQTQRDAYARTVGADGFAVLDALENDADLLVKSRQDYGITLRGPTRPDVNWQRQVEGAYRPDDFSIDWAHQRAVCPQGKASISWQAHTDSRGSPFIQVQFGTRDCGPCAQRALCTHAQRSQGRSLRLHPQPQHEALKATRAWYDSAESKRQYGHRAGIAGTLSQGVRAFGMRRTRYRGLDKVHVQNVAIAAAINVDRLVAWFDGRPLATTRPSRFALLAPPHAMRPSETLASSVWLLCDEIEGVKVRVAGKMM